MPDGPPVPHSDSFLPRFVHGSGNYTVSTTYSEYSEYSKKAEYGSITDRFDGDLELTHPAPDIETLLQTTHLTAQLHEFNNNRQDPDWPFPNDGTTLFDVAILSVLDDVLSREDLHLTALAIPTRRIKTIFLKEARHPSTLKRFYDNLKSSEAVLAELGYDDASELVGYERFRQEVRDLPDELDGIDTLEDGREAFNAAVIRAVYAVYRNGVEVPASVADAFGFSDVGSSLCERAVRRTSKQTALRNWVCRLFDETIEPLTFARSQPRTDFRQYMGLFAASALYGCGVQTVADVSDYHYSRDTIPKGSGVAKYIRDDELPLNTTEASLMNTERQAITDQFDAVHRATLELAEQFGFSFDSRSLAVDLYRIEWNGVENDVTINRPAKSENDVRSQWTYAVFGIIDTEARFTLGSRWLSDKSAYPEVLNELAPIADDFIDVEALYADSELISGELIDVFRDIADSEFVVRAPDAEIIKLLKKYTPKNRVGYIPNVSWNTSPSPAAVAYPYDSSNPSHIEFTAGELKAAELEGSEDQLDLSEFMGTNKSSGAAPATLADQFDDPASVPGVGKLSTHAAYLTGRSVPDRSGSGVHFPYYQRWALEESINQISNDFMPVINSSDEKLRLYGVNVAILFQNWHTLINRALSPELGLRLNVTHSELLRAIENVAFSDTE